MTTFTLGGLTFEEGADGAPEGVFYFDDLGDWYTGAPSKTSLNERNQAHGTFRVTTDWRSAAAFTFTGWYEGVSWADALAKMRLFNEAVTTMQAGTVVVTDELGPKSRDVLVRSSPVVEDKLSKSFSFAIDMVAPDPLAYGPPVEVSTGLPTAGGGLAYPLVYPVSFGAAGNPGRVIVSNPGTAETFSILEFTGGMSGGFEFTEISTGRVNRFVRPVPAGSTVLINLRTGRAFLDGPSDVTQYWTRQERWSVPRGGSRTIQFAALGVVTGTPTLTARTAPGNW